MKAFRFSKNDVFVLSPLFILSFLFCMSFSAVVVQVKELQSLINVIEYVCYSVLAFSIVLSQKYRIKETIFVFAMVLLGLIVKANTGYGWVLFITLIVFSTKRVSFTKMCKAIFSGFLLSLIFVVFMYAIGVSDSGLQRRGYSGFGFSHPNNFSEIIMVMFFLQAYLQRKRKKVVCFIAVILGIFNFIVLGNRTASILLILYPSILFVLERLYKNQNNKRFRLIKNVLIMTFPICQIFSVVTALLYTKFAIIQQLSLLLNSRIFEAFYNLNYFGYSLFGTTTNFTEYTYDPTRNLYFQYNVLDNSYIGVLIEMGTIAAVIWGVIHVINAKEIDRNMEVELMAIYILCSIFGLMESSFRIIFVDFTLIYLLSTHTNLKSSVNAAGVNS